MARKFNRERAYLDAAGMLNDLLNNLQPVARREIITDLTYILTELANDEGQYDAAEELGEMAAFLKAFKGRYRD